MHYLAIQPSAWLPEPPAHWNARHPLWQDAAQVCARLSPVVYQHDGYWVIDTRTVQRLHGGLHPMTAQFAKACARLVQQHAAIGCGHTPLQAVARLQLWRPPTEQSTANTDADNTTDTHRIRILRQPPVADLPLALLPQWHPHRKTLQALGWHTWGHIRALPTAQATRRFGRAALLALDQAYGDAAHQWPLMTHALQFDQRCELPALASNMADLHDTAQALLACLCAHLRQHHAAATAIAWTWHFEPSLQSRSAGLAPKQHLRLHSSQASAQEAMWWRLTHAHWERQTLERPVESLQLQLQAHETQTHTTPNLLASSHAPHQHTERPPQASTTWTVCLDHIQAKLGDDAVRVLQLHPELLPEQQQTWQAYSPHYAQQLERNEQGARAKQALAHKAQHTTRSAVQHKVQQAVQLDTQLQHIARIQSWQGMRPTWLLRPPKRLVVNNHMPQYGSELQLLMGPERLELVAWHSLSRSRALLRDYYVAWAAQCGPVWIFKTNTLLAHTNTNTNTNTNDNTNSNDSDTTLHPPEWVWYLHGFYG
jgi:hypothetical protein